MLLVDDHAVVREGYKRLLERRGDIAVIGEAANATDAYEQFCKLSPQVVVMDIALPGVSGIDAMTRILARQPETRVLIFSACTKRQSSREPRPARGRVRLRDQSQRAERARSKPCTPSRKGKRYISADIAQKLALRNVVADTDANGGLSAREFEVLRLLVQGSPCATSRSRWGLNPKTVANHQSAIKQKLGADTAVQPRSRHRGEPRPRGRTNPPDLTAQRAPWLATGRVRLYH